MVTYEVVIDNARIQTHCNPEATCPMDITAVENFFKEGHDNYVLYGDVWNDNDDSTFAPMNDSDPIIFTGPRGIIPVWTGGEIKGMTLRFRASATGDVNQPMFAELDDASGIHAIMRFYGGASTGQASQDSFWGPGANFDIPNDGVIRDYICVVDQHMIEGAGWDNLNELRDDLTSGNCWVYLWPDAFYDSEDFPEGIIKIYQASLEIVSDYCGTSG